MNLYVASDYIENINRLALGIRPIDPILGHGVMHQVRIDIEYQIPHYISHNNKPYYQPQSRGKLPTTLSRHRSGRYTLLYYPEISDEIIIRLFDYQRYYIPRRLNLALPSLEDVVAIETTEQRDYFSTRIREPVLFPGAAYDICSRSTGLRGRVVRDNESMSWAVIEARLPSDEGADPGPLVGRARGDDRGEFILLIAPEAIPVDDIDSSGDIEIEVSIAGPITVPTPGRPDIPDIDVHWDLPIETIPLVGDIDLILNGEELPPDYQFSDTAQRNILFHLGRIMSSVEIDDFVFSLA